LPSTSAPGSTLAVDPELPWWLQGNYAPVLQEVDAIDLIVRGALPPELTGLYVKNGSNPPHADSPHWFFGDGMVHGVRLDGGRASWYRNRYVQTQPHKAGVGFGQGAPGGEGNQSNVSAIWHSGTLLTSGEVGFPYALSPADLSTLGTHTFGGALTGSFTAHPKIDPRTGRMHAFGYGFSDPLLAYYVIEPDGTMTHNEPVAIPRSTMIHDFQITESDAVFWDLPVVFDLDMAIKWIGDPAHFPLPYRWEPEAGARVGVMPLAGGADAIQWFDIDPCYVFHSVNAFRRGDDVVVDVCRMDSMFAEHGEGIGGGSDPALVRWTMNTASGKATQDVLDAEHSGDLPGRDPRRVGIEHRYGYLTGTRPNPDTVELGDIIKHDFTNGVRTVWNPGPTRHATEPLFIPGDQSDDSDDAGWLLSFVHDDAVNETVLAVLDASAVEAGPVAEVVMPQRVPYGFHATWVTGAGD
jgi:carotenoid cleavage dioxygenase